jgi:hypothetical protein
MKAAEKSGLVPEIRERVMAPVGENPGGFVAGVLGREMGL